MEIWNYQLKIILLGLGRKGTKYISRLPAHRQTFTLNWSLHKRHLIHIYEYNCRRSCRGSFNMKINFICNYINTWKHIFWLHNGKYITKWYCVYLPKFSCRGCFEKRKEGELINVSGVTWKWTISNVFIPFWIPCSHVMNVWLAIYCSLYEFQQTIFKWMNS